MGKEERDWDCKKLMIKKKKKDRRMRYQERKYREEMQKGQKEINLEQKKISERKIVDSGST